MQRRQEEGFTTVLAAARTGARWACTWIWREYSPGVAAFLTARGSREAEDLTSEVFLAVFDRIPDFDGDEPALRSFIYSVAYRRLVDELRMRSRRGDHVEWSADTDPRREVSAEDAALGRLGDEAALRLLDGLSADQRDVISLRVVADLSVEQVAGVLGKRPGAVKALQRRGLEALRRRLPPTRTLPALSRDSGE